MKLDEIYLHVKEIARDAIKNLPTEKELIQQALLESAVNDWLLRDTPDGKSTFKCLVGAFDDVNRDEKFGTANATLWYDAVRDPAFKKMVYKQLCQKNTLKKFPTQARRVDLDGLPDEEAVAVAVLDEVLFVNHCKKIYKYTIVPTTKDKVPIPMGQLEEYPPSERRISLTKPTLLTYQAFIRPTKMTACKLNKCLYVFDFCEVHMYRRKARLYPANKNKVYRIDMTGNILAKWEVKVGKNRKPCRDITTSGKTGYVYVVHEKRLFVYQPDGTPWYEIPMIRGLAKHTEYSCIQHVKDDSFAVLFNDKNYKFFGFVNLPTYMDAKKLSTCRLSKIPVHHNKLTKRHVRSYFTLNEDGHVMTFDNDDRLRLIYWREDKTDDGANDQDDIKRKLKIRAQFPFRNLVRSTGEYLLYSKEPPPDHVRRPRYYISSAYDPQTGVLFYIERIDYQARVAALKVTQM